MTGPKGIPAAAAAVHPVAHKAVHKRADISLISSPGTGVLVWVARWGHRVLIGGTAVAGVRQGKCFSIFGFLSFSVGRQTNWVTCQIMQAFKVLHRVISCSCTGGTFL